MFTLGHVTCQSMGPCLLIGLQRNSFKVSGNVHEQLGSLIDVNDPGTSLSKLHHGQCSQYHCQFNKA